VVRAECLSELTRIRHGFFTRQGGVSGDVYRSLNCGLGSRDEPALVRENRARVARMLGGEPEHLVTLYQVHSATALIIERALPRANLPKADALVTRTPGLVIGAMAADCAPVLFADPEARIVGAAHAGWRGALDGILEATVAAMVRLGARASRIRAAVGPCINHEHYEIGPEFEKRFLDTDPANARFFARQSGGYTRFDLPAFVEARLQRAGLCEVERRSPCTYGNESHFFSYRRATHRGDPDYGRQISAIVVA
jgi:YfiH family protein